MAKRTLNLVVLAAVHGHLGLPGWRLLSSLHPHPTPTSLISNLTSVDVKQNDSLDTGDEELCESRGGRPGLPVPNSP